MGGRGSKSGGGGGGSGSEEKISPMTARIYFNGAKKDSMLNATYMPKRDSKIERDIRTGNAEYINSITSEKEARRVSEYLIARRAQNSRKIVKLGSREAVHKEQKTAQERKKIIKAELAMRSKMKQVSKKPEPLDPTLQHRRTTTTYDRARSRRMKNFESWFYGGSK